MKFILISALALGATTAFGVPDEFRSPDEFIKIPTRSNPRITGGRPVPFVIGGERVMTAKGDASTLAFLSQLQANRGKNTQSGNTYSAYTLNNRLLVVYDNWSDYKHIGELFGRQMGDLLSHFGWQVDLVPTHLYKKGMIGSHRATVYMGVFYDTNLPADFRSDVLNTTKPVCWTGYNLWKIAWNSSFAPDPNFEKKYGFRYEGINSGYKSVTYKSTELNRLDPGASKLRITNSWKACNYATMKNVNGSTDPYILRSGNLWVVADNPISSVQYSYIDGHDRMLAFADVLHDVTNSGIWTNRRAYVRIEDVGASADPVNLRRIADVLKAENVPFVVSAIPFYRDPLGYWNSGVAFERTLDNATEVVSALKYMESKGGRIIMHGYTHQYNDVTNPYTGVSGSDWEFYRVQSTPEGGYSYVAPVLEDSTAWVTDRVLLGKQILKRAGFAEVTGWLTPHYMASAAAYSVFANQFKYSLCTTTHFTRDANGYIYYQPLFTPYSIKDEYGTIRIPETLSYISPSETNMSAKQIINRAADMRVVRDGWAGMYFHPFLNPDMLREAVRGVKNQGFTFVLPNETYGPKPR